MGLAIGPISLATCWLQFGDQGVSGVDRRAAKDDERDDALSGHLVCGADDGGLGHAGMGDERGFDLGGGDPVAADVHHVVDPAEQPQRAVGVVLRAVTGEVVALGGEPGPVGVLVPFVVAEDGAQHGGPGFVDDQVPALAVADGDVLRR